MQLDPVNNEDHTQHVVQWAGPSPPAKSYGGKTAAHAQSVPRVYRPLVGSVGERLPPTQPHHLFTSVPWFFRGRDRCGGAAKGFTPLCSNYPQLAPGHTLWWVLGVERRPTPLRNYTASSCGLYRVSEGRDDRTSPREVSVRFV